MIWASLGIIFEYFPMRLMASCPVASFGKIWYGHHQKTFAEYFQMAMIASRVVGEMGVMSHMGGKVVRCQNANAVVVKYLRFAYVWHHDWCMTMITWIFCIFWRFFGIFIVCTNKAKHGWTIDQKWQFPWDIQWFIFRVKFPKKEIDYVIFGVDQLCSLGQWLSKCGYMTVFGADFIKILTDWFSGFMVILESCCQT